MALTNQVIATIMVKDEQPAFTHTMDVAKVVDAVGNYAKVLYTNTHVIKKRVTG